MRIAPVPPVYHIPKDKIFEEYYFNMPRSKYLIFLDMDGVICDFDGRFEELIHYTPKEFEYKFGTEAFKKEVLQHGTKFWSEIKWTADGRLLWNYLKKYAPNILTRPLDPEKSTMGKIEWIYRHLGKNVSFNFAKDKSLYADITSILIDDNEENCTAFRKAGGKAILFTNATDTINILKKVYNLQ